jgi:hypothetical protein
MTTKVRVRVEDLNQKYPTFEGEFHKHWRKIVRKALSEQVCKNPNSKTLRGIKDITRNHFTILLEDHELNKVVDMISTRFNSRKLSTDWDEWREELPNIFPEKSVGKINWFEDDNGIPETMVVNDEKKVERNDGCAIIIIQHGNFRSEYTNVPADVALTINAELSKSLA